MLSADPLSGPPDAGTAPRSRPPAVDGRTARGARARTSIAEALDLPPPRRVARPTARQVAEQAGVSLRLVFHHFEDMESLLESAVDVQVERHWKNLEVVSSEGDLARAGEGHGQSAGPAVQCDRAGTACGCTGCRHLAHIGASARLLTQLAALATAPDFLARAVDADRRILTDMSRATGCTRGGHFVRDVGPTSAACRQIEPATCQVVERLVLGVLGQVQRAEQKSPTTEHRSELTMKLLRTPDERFDGLPGFDFGPHYVEIRRTATGQCSDVRLGHFGSTISTRVRPTPQRLSCSCMANLLGATSTER